MAGGAVFCGIHIEGPFPAANKGAHPAGALKLPRTGMIGFWKTVILSGKSQWHRTLPGTPEMIEDPVGQAS